MPDTLQPVDIDFAANGMRSTRTAMSRQQTHDLVKTLLAEACRLALREIRNKNLYGDAAERLAHAIDAYDTGVIG